MPCQVHEAPADLQESVGDSAVVDLAAVCHAQDEGQEPVVTASVVIDGLRAAESELKADALLHARRWFHESAARTLRRIRHIPEGASTTAQDLALVAELLRAALEPGDRPTRYPQAP